MSSVSSHDQQQVSQLLQTWQFSRADTEQEALRRQPAWHGRRIPAWEALFADFPPEDGW